MDKTIIETAIAELNSGVSDIKNAQGFFGLIKIAPHVIEKVESIGTTLGIKGADKKDLALDILFTMIPMPWWFPTSMAKTILGAIIDAVVLAINKKIGKA